MADAAGVLPIRWLDNSLVYKVVVNTSADVLITSDDPATDPLISQSVLGAILYPRTAAEIAAGFTPTNYTVPAGNALRGGAVGNAVNNDLSALQAAYNSVPTDGEFTFPQDGRTFYIGTAAVGLVFDGQKHINFNGAKFTWNGSSGVAMQIGTTTPGLQRYVTIRGEFELIRTATIVQNGSQTAASQLLGTGVLVTNLADGSQLCDGRKRVYGFQYGYYLQGIGAGCTATDYHGLTMQECLVDLFRKNDASANSFITQNNFFGIRTTYNSTFYSSSAGTRHSESSRNGHTIDGDNFYGCQFQSLKERKVKEDGSVSTYYNTYFDTPSGGTDIECTANSSQITFYGGATLRNQVVSDAGSLNSFVDPFYKQSRHNAASTGWQGSESYSYNGASDLRMTQIKMATTLTNGSFFDFTTLPAAKFYSFDVTASPSGERGGWTIKADGTSSVKVFGTANTDNAGTGGKLSVYGSGTAPRVYNALGTTQTVVVIINYSE